MQILITGATGNVGMEVLKALVPKSEPHRILAGIRDVEKGRETLAGFPDLEVVEFDFDHTDRFGQYLAGIDVLFLLRPPPIADVEKYFRPLVEASVKQGVRHIVFLSVQGADKSKLIPHHKIEKLIIAAGIPYTFLRPAYFMQNFSTTLRNDIVERDRVYLPAGKAKFTVVDLKDLGEVAAQVLLQTEPYRHVAMDLTNDAQLSFSEMCQSLSAVLGRHIEFVSPNLLSFFLEKRKEKVPTPLILVMIMLHYLPRFQSTPPTSGWVERILGRKAIGFEDFVRREKDFWL
jgi:uncharacterized protein YbjT (DUF2867 family)